MTTIMTLYVEQIWYESMSHAAWHKCRKLSAANNSKLPSRTTPRSGQATFHAYLPVRIMMYPI